MASGFRRFGTHAPPARHCVVAVRLDACVLLEVLRGGPGALGVWPNRQLRSRLPDCAVLASRLKERGPTGAPWLVNTFPLLRGAAVACAGPQRSLLWGTDRRWGNEFRHRIKIAVVDPVCVRTGNGQALQAAYASPAAVQLAAWRSAASPTLRFAPAKAAARSLLTEGTARKARRGGPSEWDCTVPRGPGVDQRLPCTVRLEACRHLPLTRTCA